MIPGRRRGGGAWRCLALLVLAAAAPSCSAPPPRFVEAPPRLPDSEWAARVAAVESLVAAERYDEALAAVDHAAAQWPPEEWRMRLSQLAADAPRLRFHRAHPLRLTLGLDRERYAFGDEALVRLELWNLGDDEMRLPARHRSWLDRLLFRAGERANLLLAVTSVDVDASGSSVTRTGMLDVDVEEDLVLGPGGRAEVEARVPLAPGPGALYRRLEVGAVLRPLALIAESGERRYDPLPFPPAAARVFHREHEAWLAGGLTRLREALASEASGPVEEVYVTALGLPRGEVRDGLALLARAAPSLDAARQRAAQAAFTGWTARAFGSDPVRLLSWWEQEGARLPDAELLRGPAAVEGR